MTTALTTGPKGWEAVEARLATVLPKHVDDGSFIQAALAVFRRPLLKACSQKSILGCIWECAVLGLSPDSVMQQVAIIPFKGVATLIPMYPGLLELCRRSGELAGVSCEAVYANDLFEYEDGTTRFVRWSPYWKVGQDEPGDPFAVFAILHLVNGGKHIKVMRYGAALAYKEFSAAVKAGKQSPWDTDEPAMVRKTCLRQVLKYAPRTTQLQRALYLDEQADLGRQALAPPDANGGEQEKPPEHDDLIDGEATDVTEPPADGAVPPPDYPPGEEPLWEQSGEPDPEKDGR